VIWTPWIEASARSNAGERTAPRVNVRPKWGLLSENFKKLPPPYTFEIPLKPPLLLFDFPVQSEPAQCSWVLAHT
jgi:hypothetical protein